MSNIFWNKNQNNLYRVQGVEVWVWVEAYIWIPLNINADMELFDWNTIRVHEGQTLSIDIRNWNKIRQRKTIWLWHPSHWLTEFPSISYSQISKVNLKFQRLTTQVWNSRVHWNEFSNQFLTFNHHIDFPDEIDIFTEYCFQSSVTPASSSHWQPPSLHRPLASYECGSIWSKKLNRFLIKFQQPRIWSKVRINPINTDKDL